MGSSVRRSVLAAVVFAFVAGLAAAFVPPVTPGTGTIGTQFTVAGTGFGTGKPKAALVPTAGGKPVTLSVSAPYSDTQVLATVKSVKKGQTGTFDLVVTPAGKGATPVTFSSAVTLSVGQIDTVTPASPAAGADVTITGSLFGSKKPKVTVGGKKAKVKSFSDTQVVATLHKRTPTGSQDLVLTNKLGAAVKTSAVDVGGSGSGGGTASVRARLDRSTFNATGAAVVTSTSGSGFSVTATATAGGVPTTITMDFANADLTDRKPQRIDPVSFSVQQGGAVNTTWTASAAQIHATVRVGPPGTTISVDFDGGISRTSGTGTPDPLPVATGSARVPQP